MTRIRKTLLIVGVLVCFGPSVIVLLFGVTVGGPQILFWERLIGPGALVSFTPMVGGALGVIGIANVVLWICVRRRFVGPRVNLGLLVAGLAGIFVFFVQYPGANDFGDLLTPIVFPVAGTVFLGYLARNFLFRTMSGASGRDAMPSA
jgi:hypothetical protein